MELLAGQLEVCGDVGEDCGECSDAKRTVLWNRNMMLAVFSGRQPQMTAGLSRDRIAYLPKNMGEIVSR